MRTQRHHPLLADAAARLEDAEFFAALLARDAAGMGSYLMERGVPLSTTGRPRRTPKIVRLAQGCGRAGLQAHGGVKRIASGLVHLARDRRLRVAGHCVVDFAIDFVRVLLAVSAGMAVLASALLLV